MIWRVLLTFFWMVGAATNLASAQVQDVQVTPQAIEQFDRNDPRRTTFGALKFVGGMVLRSTNPHFGAISGMRIRHGGLLTAVADTGFWFQGKIIRDEAGVPVAIGDSQMAPVLDVAGKPFAQKWHADTEGLTFLGDTAYVSTEMDTRVLRFDPSANLLQTPSVRITKKFKHPAISASFSFEAIATLPNQHSFSPGLLLFAEADLTGNERSPAFIIKGTKLLSLTVRQSDGYFITDADFLPSGDLLLLERRYSLVSGQAMRLRRISGESIMPGAELKGEVLLEATDKQVTDNMEALSVFPGPGGETRIAIMSDNNHWLMQRTLYLEFSFQK